MGQNGFVISVSFLEWKKDLSVPCSIFQQWLQKTFFSCRPFYLHTWYILTFSVEVSSFCHKTWNYTWVKPAFLKVVRNGVVNGIFITNAINSRFFFSSFGFPKLLSFDSLGVNKINSTLLIMFVWSGLLDFYSNFDYNLFCYVFEILNNILGGFDIIVWFLFIHIYCVVLIEILLKIDFKGGNKTKRKKKGYVFKV